MFTNSLIIQWLVLMTVFWIALFLYFVRKCNYWKNKNVPYAKPLPFFGNSLDVLTFKKSIGDLTRQIYTETTHPYIGFFIFNEPCLLIRDPELAKKVLVKDFSVFSNRSVTENKEVDPMGSHVLFVMKTPDWRDMRKKITPVFTSGRMKNMFRLIEEAAEDMMQYIKREVDKNFIVDIREVSAKYTTDAITSTSFGINANCFKYEDSEFRVVSRRVFNWAILERALSMSCYFLSPTLVKLFKLKFIDKATSDFLRTAFWKTMNDREERKFVRNDLLDILIDIKKHEEVDDPNKLEGDKIVAQATQFFVAGFETTSSTISFALYELAHNKKIQQKLRDEILGAISKHGSITYDSLKEMDYLDMCIKETLRMYPVLPFIDRRCSSDYQIPGTDVTLEKGSAIFISSWGLHYDPAYFPKPELYDPTRFSEQNINTRPAFSYLPFGEGPRNCIGARFGVTGAKLGVAKIISEFEIDLEDSLQYPLELETKGILLAPKSKLLLKFKKHTKSQI